MNRSSLLHKINNQIQYFSLDFAIIKSSMMLLKVLAKTVSVNVVMVKGNFLSLTAVCLTVTPAPHLQFIVRPHYFLTYVVASRSLVEKGRENLTRHMICPGSSDKLYQGKYKSSD